jgi:HSP20 family protein
MSLARFQRPSLWQWNPVREFDSLEQELNRFFIGNAFGGFAPGWTPALDVHEDAQNLVVTAELPGLTKEAIEITVNDGVLSISGERKESQESKDGEVVRNERFQGSFVRSLTLPKPVAVDQTKASYQNGILTITLPKAEAARPKSIPVSVN